MVETQTKHYDVVCMGAGSGSMGMGRRASLLGKKVVMIENRRIGGTCVNVGCVPKKVMFNLANFVEETHLFKDYGVSGVENLKLDFKHFKAQRDAYVLRLNGIYKTNIAKQNIDYMEGTASFVSDKEVQVVAEDGTKTLLTGDHILIANGSAPQKGGFEGAELCWNSDDFFSMEELPESCAVIGGGYIGIELAQILQALGVKVTLIVRSIPLRFLDRDICDLMVENMIKLGLDVKLQAPHDKVTKNQDGTINVHMTDGSVIKADKCIVALGRPPLLENLGLQNTGIKTEKGAIAVDEFQNTTVSGVYAIGDVTNQITLTPVAIRAGRILSERLFNNRPTLKMSYENVATVIFSHPPIGTVGMSEADARKQFGDENVEVFNSSFINMFYSPAASMDKKLKSLFKVVTRKTSEGNGLDNTHLKVMGVHGIGKNIDEMMQGISIAINMGATKQDFDNSVAIHPTASEEFALLDPKFEEEPKL